MTARAPGAVLALGAAALAALLGGILALLAAKAGPLALVLPGLLVASMALTFVPKATATIAVVAVAVLEADPAGFLGGYTARYYETLAGAARAPARGAAGASPPPGWRSSARARASRSPRRAR